MAYQLTISRGYQWTSDGTHQLISLEEWEQYIAAHSLEKIDSIQGRNPATGETLDIKCPNSARISPDGPLIIWRDGVLDYQGDPEELDLCRPLATALNASIYGEEGETY